MHSHHRSALFILNPASGHHDADDTEVAVTDRLRDGGIDVEVRRTEAEGDARRWVQRAAADGQVDLVVVAGGDGTVREKVSGVVASGGDVAIAVFPLGTADLLARALGVPTDDPVVVDADMAPDDGVLHVGVGTDPGATGAVLTALTMAADDPAGVTPFELELLPGAATILVPCHQEPERPEAASSA